MTEEVSQEVVDTSTETTEQDVHQPSEIEQRATEMGWRPRDTFDGSEDDFIDAKEFVRRKPLFDKIESLSKDSKNTKKALEALKVHYTKVQESAVLEAINRMKGARQEAIQNGDGDAFEKADNRIKQAETQLEQIKQIQQTPLVQETPSEPEEFVNWKNKNRWYSSDDGMTVFADALGIKLKQQNPDKAPNEILKLVEDRVKQEFPHKFTNQRKSSAPDVDSSRGSSKHKAPDETGLSDQERQIMNTLVRGGHITKEKYLADLKAVKKNS